MKRKLSMINRLFKRRSKKTSKLRVTGLCAGNSPVTGEFPAQMASNAENVSIWWRHHVFQDSDCPSASETILNNMGKWTKTSSTNRVHIFRECFVIEPHSMLGELDKSIHKEITTMRY